jgi:hypothetical protein
MQAKALSERELVKMAMEESCKKAGFAAPEGMVQRDLEFLVKSIESKSGVLISLSTIKRLMHGEFTRLPQVATLNALAMFIGHENWQRYKQSKFQESGANMAVNIEDTKVEEKKNQLSPGVRPKTFSYKKYILLGGFIALSTLGLLAILKFRHPGFNNIANAQFSARKTTKNDLPNTVIFNYNIDEVIADSFFIQQSWDKNRRIRISKNNYTLTDIYYEPGYHIAKLIADDKIIKTIHVSIPTDRWFFYAKEEGAKNRPKYIHAEKGINKGSLQFTHKHLLNSQVNTKGENEYIQVYFPEKIEESSDDFTLNFRIRVNPLNNDACPYFMGEVFCQKNFMFFTSTPKGCASEIITQFGERFRNGKTNDFSALASDPKVWQDVELEIKNKTVSITINGKNVFSTKYQESGGLITGIGFLSNGLVEVDYVHLKTGNGKSIYSNDFD